MAQAEIFNTQQVPSKILQEVERLLTSAAEAFNAKSYNKAAGYFNAALNLMFLEDVKATTIILTKYMICACWLESRDAKNLSDALKILEELENQYAHTYPMVYHAIGRAYFKLYRFNKADEIVKKGFSVLNSDINVTEYYIPGTDIIIPESSKEHLVAALMKLSKQCSCWHRPDAVCCIADCPTINNNEAGDKNIFFGNPTFIGMVQVTCNNPFNCCIIRFHLACWKAKKELLSSYGKMSDKEVLHSECFTPNCNNKGVRCTIRRIEIFDENAQIKATIESRPDEAIWHTKTTLPPKGAIRKQLPQTPKSNGVSSETRITEQRARRPRPSLVSNGVLKVDEIEEEDDTQDELKLKLAIQNLKHLRAKNFGVKDDMIWCPNLSMYGNQYMLETSEGLPDPDFFNGSPEEQEMKSSVFSYLYALISNDGPVKLDELNKNWNEVIDQKSIEEFLLQSLKFAIVGGYVCTANKLQEAYKLTKTDACKILTSAENNQNQQRTHSLVDDDKNLVDGGAIASRVSIDTSSNSSKSPDEPNNLQSIEERILLEARTPELCAENINALIKELSPRPTVNGTGNVHEIENPLGCSSTQLTTMLTESLKEAESISDVKTDGTNNFYTQMVIAISNITKVDKANEIDGHPITENHNISSEFLKAKKPALFEAVSDVCIHPDLEKNTSLNVTFNKEVQRLNQVLAASKEAIKWLKSEITEMRKSHIELVKSMLQRILHNQYLHNDSVITEKIAEWEKNNNILLEIQKLLKTFTGQTVPVATKSDLILDIKKIQENNTEKYSTLNNQLSMSSNLKELPEVEDVMLNDVLNFDLPEFDLIGIIQSAFNFHRMHVMNEYTCMPTRGQLPPQVPPTFNRYQTPVIPVGPPGQFFPSNLNQNYVHTIHPAAFPAANIMMVRQAHHNNSQAMYRPSSNCFMPNVRASTQQNGTFTLNPFPPSLPILNMPSEDKPCFINNSPNLARSIDKSKDIDLCKMQQIIKLSDELNGRTSKVTKTPLTLQPEEQPRVHVHEQINVIQAQPGTPTTAGRDIAHVNNINMDITEDIPQCKMQQIIKLSDELNGRTSKVTKMPLTLQPEEQPRVHVHEPINVVHAQPGTPTTAGRDIAHVNNINMDITEDIPQCDPYTNPTLPPKYVEKMTSNDSHLGYVAEASGAERKGKSPKKTARSMDKLMRKLRSQYPGVLELDLLKSVECVRETHNNSLTRLPMHRIIQDAHVFITLQQLKQLCKYDSHKQDRIMPRHSSHPHFFDDKFKRRDSVSSTSSASSLKYDSPLAKKPWVPITIPNATWVNQNKESECAICFEKLLIKAEDSYTLKCKHAFHKKCIKKWYQHNQSCPTCRVHSMIDDDYPPLPLY